MYEDKSKLSKFERILRHGYEILFLDFDMTITENHTGGECLVNAPFTNKVDEKCVMGILKEVSGVVEVIVITRGLRDSVNEYLLKHGLGFEVLGSSTRLDIKRNDWAERKTSCIFSIMKSRGGDSVLFIDDEKKNVKFARGKSIPTFHTKHYLETMGVLKFKYTDS